VNSGYEKNHYLLTDVTQREFLISFESVKPTLIFVARSANCGLVRNLSLKPLKTATYFLCKQICRGFQPLSIINKPVPAVSTAGYKYIAVFDGFQPMKFQSQSLSG